MSRFVMSVILGWSFNCAAEFKVGVVDLQRAILGTSDGQRAKSILEGEFKKRQEVLRGMQLRMEKMGENFERKALALSVGAKERGQKELQFAMRKFQDAVAQNQSEMDKLQRELLGPVAIRLSIIVADIGKREAFAIVLSRGEQVLFATKEIDITDKVVAAYTASPGLAD